MIDARSTHLLAPTLIVVLAWVTAAPHAQADTAEHDVQRVVLGGSGVLTKCRSWILFRTCNTYDDVRVPPVTEVGGQFRIEYGSNTKYYDFPVVRIVEAAGTCTLYGETGTDKAKLDHIVAPCRALDASG